MLAAIAFDDELVFVADEVGNVRPNRFLTLEFQAHEAIGAQVIPAPGCGRGVRGEGFLILLAILGLKVNG
ncbi:MAG: hypothetical protein AB7U99_01520 [Steroidobacteraceae bacterium]